MKKYLLFISTCLLAAFKIQAATLIPLSNQPLKVLGPYMQPCFACIKESRSVKLTTINRQTDMNQTAHVKLKQTYNGYEIWNAQAIVHLPYKKSRTLLKAVQNNHLDGSLSGEIYQGIEQDLANNIEPTTKTQKNAVNTIQEALKKRLKTSALSYTEKASKTIVFINNQQTARFAYLMSFYYEDANGAHRPTAIVDAETLSLYRLWDEIMNFHEVPKEAIPTKVGGIGGNTKIGPIRYDDKSYPALEMSLFFEALSLNGKTNFIPNCYLANKEAYVIDHSYDEIAKTNCPVLDQNPQIRWISNYQSEFWDDDSANGGYSPSLDVLFGAQIVFAFYRDWFQLPVIMNKDGSAKRLELRTHFGREFANAQWDNVDENIKFGDGNQATFPFTSLSLLAHEMSHAFTYQHSGLDRSKPESAALHESFSDMASKAVEFYVNGSNHWYVGEELLKQPGVAIRYLDDPTKDGRSIDHLSKFIVDQWDFFRDMHLDAGIYNKAFYLIATAKNWDTHKAFNIMVQANRFYWTSGTTFTTAACGVLKATIDYGYDLPTVTNALEQVGINTQACT